MGSALSLVSPVRVPVPAYRVALEAGATALGLQLRAAEAAALEAHHQLVQRWAKKINLTTITDPAEAAVLHGLDAWLFSAQLEGLDPGARVVDVGSGGGFPGVACAIACPALSFTLLEPIRKRASFLRVALGQLDLEAEVQVVEGKLRAPEARLPAAEAALWPAEAIVSRATIPPLSFLPLAAPRLAPGGRLVLSQGRGGPSEAELAEAAAAAGLSLEQRQEFELPGGALRVLHRWHR